MLELHVGRALDPPMSEREMRALVELLASMRRSFEQRLPIGLELVELDIELRRRLPLEASKSAGRSSRERR